MPQTMLAVLAMMLFFLFAVRQQEQIHLAQNPMIPQAVGALFNGIAAEGLAEIESNSNDRGLIDTEPLAPSGSFASSPTNFDTSNDPPFKTDLGLVVSEGPDVPKPRSRSCDHA